jgi:hypothetical protein
VESLIGKGGREEGERLVAAVEIELGTGGEKARAAAVSPTWREKQAAAAIAARSTAV